MPLVPFVGIVRGRYFRKIIPWFFLLGLIGFVRSSKGTLLVDTYAILTSPFWPGPSQKDWLKSGVYKDSSGQSRLTNKRVRALVNKWGGFGDLTEMNIPLAVKMRAIPSVTFDNATQSGCFQPGGDTADFESFSNGADFVSVMTGSTNTTWTTQVVANGAPYVNLSAEI